MPDDRHRHDPECGNGRSHYQLRAIIGVTEPRAHFKGQAAEPDAFKLREGLNIKVSIEILAIGKAAQAVVPLTDIAHAKVETADPAGNADARQ